MSLPLQWVDRIFDKLTLTYGQAFLSRWRDIDLNAVKSDWAHELAVFERAPNAIAFALSNLSEKPPSVADFKALCRQAPATEAIALPLPKADPERVRHEFAKLAPLRARIAAEPPKDSRAWAHRIIERHSSGKKISPTVLLMAQSAVQAA